MKLRTLGTIALFAWRLCWIPVTLFALALLLIALLATRSKWDAIQRFDRIVTS